MLLHLARRGETVALDFNGLAPGRAHESMFPLAGGVSEALFAWPRVEGAANEFGPRSVAVPGSVAGLALALERYGTLDWRDALAPAIALARDGFRTDWYLALTTAKLMEELSAFPPTAAAYLRDARWVYRPPSSSTGLGDRIVYPDLARTLERLAREGPPAFYRGAIGQAICEHLAAHGGLVDMADLAAYEVRVAPVLAGRYRDLDLAFSPGATGGITALETLNILEQFAPARVGWRTAEGLHLRAHAVRRAFLDRFAHLGDPAHVKADWDRFASKDYARAVARDLRRGGAGGGARASRPASDCTTHVCAVDRQRNMVSLTHTAVSLFGSRMVVPGLGVLLNNGMIWFDPEPGKPNSVAPGKRALVNMVPVLGFRRGTPALALGAPGGRRIISAIPQVIANLADGRGSLQDAVEAPRLHTEGDEVLVDERVGDKALAGLARRGHRVTPKAETYASFHFARPVGIRVTGRGLEAGLDPFGAAAAAGL
jgi:gamma-glutamyltranspeptidase/glutathione hydrolase